MMMICVSTTTTATTVTQPYHTDTRDDGDYSIIDDDLALYYAPWLPDEPNQQPDLVLIIIVLYWPTPNPTGQPYCIVIIDDIIVYCDVTLPYLNDATHCYYITLHIIIYSVSICVYIIRVPVSYYCDAMILLTIHTQPGSGIVLLLCRW